MTNSTWTWKLMVAAGLFLSAVSCRAFDAAVDCQNICSRYSSCFDSSYDVGACAQRCRDNANADSNYYRSVDTCAACITDRACASATFSCVGDCARVVP